MTTTPSPTPAPEYANEREAIEKTKAQLHRLHVESHGKMDDYTMGVRYGYGVAIALIDGHLARVRHAAPEPPAQAKPFIKTYRITDDNLVRVEQPAQAKATDLIAAATKLVAEGNHTKWCSGGLNEACDCPFGDLEEALRGISQSPQLATPPAPAAEHPAVANHTMIRAAIDILRAEWYVSDSWIAGSPEAGPVRELLALLAAQAGANKEAQP